MEKEIILPNNLDEAVNMLIESCKDDLDFIKGMSERQFMSTSHHGFGTNLRNEWNLWWHESDTMGWSKEKPKLTEYFNSLGIYHGDDLSSIILKSFYRSVVGVDRNLDEQIEVYKKHWREAGFKDGIYSYNAKS